MRNLDIEKGCALILTDRLNRKYVCGVDIAEGVVVVTDSVTAFTDARYFYAAEKSLKNYGVTCKLYKGIDTLENFIKENGVKKILVDYRTTTLREYEEYKSFNLEISDGAFIIEKARSIKDGFEIESTISACEIAQNAYHTAIKTVKEGVTELELKDKIESIMLGFGADEIAFDTIVAFGANSAVPHHQTGETKLEKDTVILVDMGCKVNGYCSDLTRTAFFGKPSKKFTDCYEAVLRANLIAEEKIVSKVSCKTADSYAREYLKQKGLDEYFTHSLGHGLGLEVHEYPTLSPRSDVMLDDGMIFTIEPGTYFDGQFGIRIEDTVILKNGKLERLFTDDKNLMIL